MVAVAALVVAAGKGPVGIVHVGTGLGKHEVLAEDVGGDGNGLVFKKGEILYKVPEERLVDALIEEIEKDN